MATEDEIRRLILEVQGQEKVEGLAGSVEHLDKTSRTYNQNVRALGYALQDFAATSGDIGAKLNSITNNIDGLLSGLTQYAGVIGIAVTAGVALYRNWDLITGSAEKSKEAQDRLTESLKEQKSALEALEKVQTEKEAREQKGRVGGVAEAVAPAKEEIRKALAEDIQRDIDAEIVRLRQEIFGRLPAGQRDFAALMQDPRFARAWRRSGQAQAEADLTIGRAVQGGAPELARLRGLFPQETEIGARLAEAGPERAAQRAEEERDVERQRRSARLREQLDRQKEQAGQKNAQAMGQAFQDEEQDLHRQQQADQHTAQEKRQADQREEAARKRAAAAKERQAARFEREGIEDIRLQVDQAVAGGAPAGLVAAQANAMLNRIAATSGRTTNLVQAQGRLMLHLQQVAERQERQLDVAERDLQRGWDNAWRRAK